MRTHCKNGHEYTIENTRPHHGRRECRACHNLREKNRARDNPTQNAARATAWNNSHVERRREIVADWSLRKRYGITLDIKRAMIAAQDGRCAACRDLIELYSSHTDHNHATGKVRAILCEPCNLTIGNARESCVRLRALADYLEAHEETSPNTNPGVI